MSSVSSQNHLVQAKGKNLWRPKIAYVSAHLPSYLAQEHAVVDRSLAALETLAQDLDFELLADWEPVVTHDQASEVADEAEVQGADLVLLQSSSFAMGDTVLPFAGRKYSLGLWAAEEPTHEGPIALNSLVSMNIHAGVLSKYLRHRAQPFKWFFGFGRHQWFAPRLQTTVAALRGAKALRGARIGWVGGLAPSFLNLSFDQRKLAARLEIEVVSHELHELVRRASEQAEPVVSQAVEELRKAARDRVEVTPEDLTTSAALYLSLRELAREHRYDALAVSDWPLFQEELGIHPGMAFSWLNEQDGIPVAAEGDVLGAASMLLGGAVSGQQAMLLDINDIDPAAGAILMWHCGGSPLGMADAGGVRWTNHSTLGRKQAGSSPVGAVADLRFRPGNATILRLGSDGSELFALDAEVVEHAASGFSGSRGWLARFRDDQGPVSLGDLINTVMSLGIEHHFALAAGSNGGTLREAAAWLGLRTTRVLPYRDHLQPFERSREWR
jgi:hypothetical protein